MDRPGGHQLPLQWLQPGPCGYDPYTNTLVPLRYYYAAYRFGVEYSWNRPNQLQGRPYSSSSVPLPLGRPPQAAAQRGRGGGTGRGRGRRQPRQHGGPGLLGADPSSQRPPQLPPPRRRRVPDEPSSGQSPVPAAPLPRENREPTPPPPASPPPISHAMTPPVSDPLKNSIPDVTMTTNDDAMMDDAQDDVLLVGLGGSSTAATTDKKRLLPLDPPAPMKNSDVDVSMARRDDGQGDVLGLNVYMARKRLLSTKASSLPADADAAEEEAKDAARIKKTRLGWGQGLAKYENLSKKDDENAHKIVAHDGAAEPGSKGHGDNNRMDDNMAEMRVSRVPTAPALFSKGSSRQLTAAGDKKNGSISSLTEKSVSPAEVPARFSSKHSQPSPADDDQNLMADGGMHYRGSISQVHAVPRKGSAPPEDNSINSSSMTANAMSELTSSSQGCDEQPDESSMEFTKDQDIRPRPERVIVKMVQKTNMIVKKNVLSDEEPETNELQGSKLKEWSQEEKDVFSEMITAFGLNFPKVSAFLLHKTTEDCIKYYAEHYKSEGAEDVKKHVNQICHESTANLLAHSLPEEGHGESSMDEHEHVTGKVLVGESNAAPSPPGMRSSQASCLAISKTEAPVLENFNEDNSSNEAVCVTKSSSKVKENVQQSVLIANHGDEGNCVSGESSGQDTLKITFYPDEISAKLANGTIKGDEVRSGAKTPELCSSLKEWNHAAKHHSRKATEKKLANSNIDDGRMAPSDMKNRNSKENHPCITSDPAAMLRGPSFVRHMMQADEVMEKKELEGNDDKVCEVMNSQKEMEKVDSIPSPDGNDLNEDKENPTMDSSPCVATNASVVRDDGLIQRPSASEKGKGIMLSPEVNDLNAPPMQISNEAPRTYHLASSSSCAALEIVHTNSSYFAMDIDLNVPLDVTPLDVTSVVDLGSSTAEASMGRSSEATESDATVEIGPSQTSTVTQSAHQLPANEPGSIILFGRVIYQAASTGTINHTPNQGNQTVVSSSNMPSNPLLVPVTRRRGRGQVYPSPSWATTTSVWRSGVQNNQQGQQQAVLSNRILYGGVDVASSSAASPPQLQPGSSTTLANMMNQQGQKQAVVLTNRILYGGLVDAASVSAASPLQLQPGSSTAHANMMNQQRQQALVNIAPHSIMRGGGVPVLPSQLIQGSGGGGAGFLNFNGFNSAQQQWPYPVVDTTRMLVGGYPFYYPANQAPATAATMPSTATNNGEGASTSNTRAPAAAAGRGRGRGDSWLSLGRN